MSTIVPPSLDEGDYDAIFAAVMESARGRWFLDEFSRRNRHADTMQVIAAISRIESLMRDRGSEAGPNFRVELLDMARAITEVRSEVAEIKPQEEPGRKRDGMASAPASSTEDIFSTAERIKDVAWAMRERGFDPATCDQIEALASAILTASALRKPGDRRAEKLADVLGYLEHRIAAMIADVAKPVPEAAAGASAADETQLRARSTKNETTPPADSGLPSEMATTAPPAPADISHPNGHAAVEVSPTSAIDLAIERMERAIRRGIATAAPSADALNSAPLVVLPQDAIAPSSQPPEPLPPPTRVVTPKAANADDPLAALRALSEEERIALCT